MRQDAQSTGAGPTKFTRGLHTDVLLLHGALSNFACDSVIGLQSPVLLSTLYNAYLLWSPTGSAPLEILEFEVK